MGDSDDEYDRRKGRDKFRREREVYDRRDDRRRDSRGDQWEMDRMQRKQSAGRAREAWTSRSRDRRDPYREYDSRHRDRGYSPPRRDISPPTKRMRRDDWQRDDSYHPYEVPGGYGRPVHGGAPHPHAWGHGHEMGGGMPQQGGAPFNPGQSREPEYPTQPPMMTFKMFLGQQEDNISDQDAIKKYNEYKLDFKRQQINEFFLAHKEEEWFKIKYHPEECQKRKEDVQASLKNRCQVFRELLDGERVEGVVCDFDKQDDIVKLLDAAVIKMEGGNDFDLTVLEQPEPDDAGNRSRNNSESQSVNESPDEKRKKKEELDKKPDEPLKLPISGEQKELMKKAREFSKQQLAKNGNKTDKKKKKKRHREKTEYSYESGSESESESGSESETEPAPPGLEDEPPPPGVEEVSGTNTTENGAQEEGAKEDVVDGGDEKDVDTKNDEEEEEKDEGPPKPRPLHKTCSIFLRNLAPSITKQEVEAMCKRYPGFVRVALQDPQPERQFFRRGWVTFSKEVNIKEICWNLNNIRLRDCELGATLNRELKQRVRPVNGITAHKKVVMNDIKQSAKIINVLDVKWKIWEETAEEKKDQEKDESGGYGLMSKNPILKNITDYLVEEGSYEEEELLGQSVEEGEKEGVDDSGVERDEKLLKVLDKMILYLRIVHSVDYYSANEYPNEDEMPHRCGIMHARGPSPSTKITETEVNEWTQNFENKLKHFIELQDKVEDDEAVKLGKKDPEAEVEKFVTANTQELAKDKWLCPMSGKKFKGPEFVRKHIFNKHGEKVDEVRLEVSFFNNYLLDPKRPQLPEHPGNKQGSQGASGGQPQYANQGGYQGHPQSMMGYNQPRPPMMYGGQQYQHPGYMGRDNYSRNDGYKRAYTRPYRSRHSDPRNIIEYRDLDAPDEADIF